MTVMIFEDAHIPGIFVDRYRRDTSQNVLGLLVVGLNCCTSTARVVGVVLLIVLLTVVTHQYR